VGRVAIVKEHGFLFCGDMVRALASTHAPKTMTRRLLTRTNSLVDGHAATATMWSRLDFAGSWVDQGPSPAGNPGPYLKASAGDSTHRIYPRVQAGDVIYVKETWLECGEGSGRYDYRADTLDGPARWSSSLFMPRRACRTLLDVVAVRPERLQDISEADACAEGVERHAPASGDQNGLTGAARYNFERLWDRLNYAKAPFVSNPLLWVYSFKRRAA
jgi:hypothetical protein